MVVQIGKERDIPVVDSWTILKEVVENKEAEVDQLLYDGLHLTGLAYKLIYAKMKTVIMKDWGWIPAEMETSFVPWDQYLDGNKVEMR